MTDEKIKEVIIDTLTEQNAFSDLSPRAVASLTIDMVLAIVKKASEK